MAEIDGVSELKTYMETRDLFVKQSWVVVLIKRAKKENAKLPYHLSVYGPYTQAIATKIARGMRDSIKDGEVDADYAQAQPLNLEEF